MPTMDGKIEVSSDVVARLTMECYESAAIIFRLSGEMYFYRGNMGKRLPVFPIYGRLDEYTDRDMEQVAPVVLMARSLRLVLPISPRNPFRNR
jgi:hypothetical protein